jgi:hypothetical protein
MRRPSNGTAPTAGAVAGEEESSTTDDDDEPTTGATNGTAGTTPKVESDGLGERKSGLL